jgi:hypothetical protein
VAALAMVIVWLVIGVIWLIFNSASTKQPLLARQ